MMVIKLRTVYWQPCPFLRQSNGVSVAQRTFSTYFLVNRSAWFRAWFSDVKLICSSHKRNFGWTPIETSCDEAFTLKIWRYWTGAWGDVEAGDVAFDGGGTSVANGDCAFCGPVWLQPLSNAAVIPMVAKRQSVRCVISGSSGWCPSTAGIIGTGSSRQRIGDHGFFLVETKTVVELDWHWFRTSVAIGQKSACFHRKPSWS